VPGRGKMTAIPGCTVKRFDRKTVLVTGAGNGIGRAACLTFAAEGAAVVIADMDEAAAAESLRLVGQAGGRAEIFVGNVADYGDCEAMVSLAEDRFGRLDVAFNNAGITGPQNHQVHEYSLDEWAQVLAVNLTGVFNCIKAEVPALKRAGGGAIVNTASVAGKVGGPRMAAYAASKHGVIGLTKAAAIDLVGHNIRVNAVCPGATRTAMLEKTLADPAVKAIFDAMHPIGRTADAAEIARVVTFLASEDASFMVGEAVSVDGGVVAQ